MTPGAAQPILRFNTSFLYRFLSFLASQSPGGLRGRILDCGAGGTPPPLALFQRHGFEAFGIDLSESQLALARQYAASKDIPMDLRLADIRAMPFDDASFDHVYEHHTLCHLSRTDTTTAIQEMARVFKPGGFGFLGMMSSETWPPTMFGREEAPGEHHSGPPNHRIHSLFREDEALALLDDWTLLGQEPHARCLVDEAARMTLDTWMALRPPASDSVKAWEERYPVRHLQVRYVHTYFLLQKPLPRACAFENISFYSCPDTTLLHASTCSRTLVCCEENDKIISFVNATTFAQRSSRILPIPWRDPYSHLKAPTRVVRALNHWAHPMPNNLYSKFVSVLAVSALMLTGCQKGSSNKFSSSPEAVVQQYFDWAKDGDMDRAMTTLCKADQNHKALLEKVGDVPILPLRNEDLLPSYSQRTTCQIKSVKMQGNTATVVTQITRPDLDSWFEHAPEMAVIILVHAHNGIQTARKVVQDSMAVTPLATEERVFDLIKEESGWRVNLRLSDFSTIEAIREKASTAEAEGRFEDAESGYNEVLQRYPHHPSASHLLTDLKERKKNIDEGKPYLPSIKISHARIDSMESEDDTKVIIKIQNDSDRSFKKVGVAYQLLDQRGKVIQDKLEFHRFSSSDPFTPEAEEELACTFEKMTPPIKGKVKARVKFLELSKGKSEAIPFVRILASHYPQILSELVAAASGKTKP